MLGFARGGAYPQVFAHCRDQGVHWVTYRRAPLAVPAALPVITAVTYAGRTRQIAWAEEKVQLKDYGDARQITLFEHGKVALQILTSDFDACPAEILSWLKSMWRGENFLKHARPTTGSTRSATSAARPTDGPAAARLQRRALAIGPPQRLPVRRRRIPRRHSRDHHPRPGQHHYLGPAAITVQLER
jgi:hypothetical protein